MTAKTIKTVCKIYDIIQVDKSNRYILIDDWVLPKLKKEVPDFEGAHIAFRASVPVILKTFDEPIIDGCSLAPDDLIINTVIGAIAHDSGYQDLDALALAWADYGWSRDDC